MVSVRIPRELKERLDKLNINVSEVIRGLLEGYVEKAELKRLEERLMRIRKRLAGRIDASTIAALVREDGRRR